MQNSNSLVFISSISRKRKDKLFVDDSINSETKTTREEIFANLLNPPKALNSILIKNNIVRSKVNKD